MGSWLRDYVICTSVLGPVEWASVLLALLGAALVARGGGSLRAAGLVLVGCAVAVVLFMLVANRVVWRGRDVLERRLLLHYVDRLESRYGQNWSVKNWVQEVDVQANGDVRQRISFTVVVLCEFLEFCTFHDRVNWDWPRRHQRRVRPKVRSVEVGGVGGTRFDFTSSWLNTRVLKMIVHLDEPAPRGGEISFSVDLFWPVKCLPLVRGDQADEFLVSFSELIPHASYIVTLPPGYSRPSYDTRGLLPGRDDYEIGSDVDDQGRWRTALTVRNIPAYQKFGMRLDLA